MWQILHASFWKFSKLSNSRIFLNWCIIDEVTTRSTKACIFGPLCTAVGEMFDTVPVKGCFRGNFPISALKLISDLSLVRYNTNSDVNVEATVPCNVVIS